MDQTSSSTFSANTLHGALELSKKSWLLAIQFPDWNPAFIKSKADTEKLMASLLQPGTAGPGSFDVADSRCSDTRRCGL